MRRVDEKVHQSYVHIIRMQAQVIAMLISERNQKNASRLVDLEGNPVAAFPKLAHDYCKKLREPEVMENLIGLLNGQGFDTNTNTSYARGAMSLKATRIPALRALGEAVLQEAESSTLGHKDLHTWAQARLQELGLDSHEATVVYRWISEDLSFDWMVRDTIAKRQPVP
jgi:hypothetical protein